MCCSKDWGYICLWVPMTTLNSKEITLCSVRYTGGYIIKLTWCHTDISLYFLISWLFHMGSHWLHCKTKSSLWALAVLKEGYIVRCTWCHTDITLYLPISWLFWMGSHWPHWKAESSLWALAVSNGGVYHKIYLVSHWHFFISSYYLTVSNGLSLTALKSEEFTLSSGSFEWGG